MVIMACMKAYVREFHQVKEDETPYARLLTLVDYIRISDHWSMPRWDADRICDDLNNAQVHPERCPEHLCQFEVEEVGPEEFAIVCNAHPDLRDDEATEGR
jgi:hypothetical protein